MLFRSDYFRYGNTNRIVHHICSGRISAWVLFHCDSGIEFLDRLGNTDAGTLALILPYIDPEFWQKKFQDYLADSEWCKDILSKAGL